MSVRERLASRGLPQATYPLCVAPAQVVGAASAAVDEARRAFLAAEARGDNTEPFRAVEEQAQANLAACYEDAQVRALAPDDMEDLLAAHPPTDEQAEKGLLWNPDTFIPALLAAAVSFADGETWAVEEWEPWVTGQAGPLALGEISGLFDTAYGLNGRTLDLRVGKG